MKCKNTQCPLHGKIEVPYTGNPKTKVIYVGGCPEYDEINMQIPHAFSGEKGKFAPPEKKNVSEKKPFIFNVKLKKEKRETEVTKEEKPIPYSKYKPTNPFGNA